MLSLYFSGEKGEVLPKVFDTYWDFLNILSIIADYTNWYDKNVDNISQINERFTLCFLNIYSRYLLTVSELKMHWNRMR